jgi:hypothetical protein
MEAYDIGDGVRMEARNPQSHLRADAVVAGGDISRW